MDEESIRFIYIYQFSDGASKHFDIRLDRSNLLLQARRPADLPLWSLLTFEKCEICPLLETEHAYCPVAANLAGVVEEFRNLLSHEKVSVTVVCEDRLYAKDTTVQGGLSPLLGIIMTTSGCPVMEQLKPMVRFHLPFASLDETIFRAVVNRDFAKRMRAAAKKDANVNALVNLDVFASMMTFAAEDTLNRLKPYFAALLDR
jgi:hypothetical protein